MSTQANMITEFFPLKKLRRNGKYVLFAAILLVGALAVYHEIVAAGAWSGDVGVNPDSSNWRRAMQNQRGRADDQPEWVEDPAAWMSSFSLQAWKPEFKGQANLHVFEDWCGASTGDLRKNQHYPLYPHSRTTVQKLAVSPQWNNYGLRIFGYLHPFADGDFVFAVSSDDNSEFWLSTDNSPLNVQLLAWVGKTGEEWTAPGEFEKYASQTSRPVRLSAQKRYFFEVIHKQNDIGTDHVEVAWQLLDHSFKFMLIESKHLSLYVDESDLMMSHVAHIPQTAASHERAPEKRRSGAADMLREDPRDTLHQVHLINSKFLQGLLPDCSYNPTYTIKDFPLLRYQGLQFVQLSYVYPNDYTRLTHMERENTCFYSESPYYKKMYGFSRYMKFDRPDAHKKGNAGKDSRLQNRKSAQEEEDYYFGNYGNNRKKEKITDQGNNEVYSDYGDDYVQNHRRKLFSFDAWHPGHKLEKVPDERGHIKDFQDRRDMGGASQPQKEQEKASKQVLKHDPHQNRTEVKQQGSIKKVDPIKKVRQAKRQKFQANIKPEHTNSSILAGKEEVNTKQPPALPSQKHSSKQHPIWRKQKTNHTRIQAVKDSQFENQNRTAAVPQKAMVAKKRQTPPERENVLHPARHSRLTTPSRGGNHLIVKSNEVETDPRKALREREIELNKPLQTDLDNHVDRNEINARGKKDNKSSYLGEEDERGHNRTESRAKATQGDSDFLWGPQGNMPMDPNEEDQTPAPVFDTQVIWNQTFQVNQLDLQSQRSDWIDLQCNVSGNMLLSPSDALTVVYAFMDRLNAKHNGRFTLVRVINIVKRVDGYRGSRYLLELELKDANGQLLRLTHYIYTLIRSNAQRSREFMFRRSQPQLLLCHPVGFRWNPDATVHFIVPIKNQARWVQQLITDMEKVFRESGDSNFNLIITDYGSTDMDVEQALQKSSLPRYKYVKLTGNFERSAGLQAGIDLIDDDHSIVFLCDLHIHFPSSITDIIRKHCVEGHMAFAPIVLRLNCGSTPSEARGYWEVNGFGLLGIYKSDLEAIGGMNTREFRERWGGEDWELLDRILQGGLEVERIYLRNFFHHYHSKRGMWNRKMSNGQM